MRRGEVWRYAAKGPRGDRVVVIVSGDGINADERRGWLLAAEVLPEDTGDLLMVPLQGFGWADAATVSRVLRRWMDERLGEAGPEGMVRLDVALRAALDL